MDLTKLLVNIKNIFLYPANIVSRRRYKLQIDFDELLSKQLLIAFARRSSKNSEETFDEHGLLREDAIMSSEIPQLSINLLGGRFKIKHIKFRTKKPASNYWEGENVFYLKYYRCIEILDPAVPIFLLLNEIQNEEFPYDMDATSQKAKAVKRVLGESIPKGTKSIRLKGTLKIKHAPTKLNYWHSEVQIFDIENKEIPKATSGWTKSAAEFALTDVIAIKAKKALSIDEYDDIDYFHYHTAI